LTFAFNLLHPSIFNLKQSLKTSEIKFTIELDEQNIPNKIFWEASDKKPAIPEETKAFSLALWDSPHNSTLKIDLWAKDMPVDEMKRFYVEAMGGMAESILNATGDQTMSSEINDLCERLGKYLESESKKGV
jgi:gliding motility-associated protein GldC